MSAMPSFTPPSLVHALARYWWLILLRGIVAIAFGVFAFVAPGLTLVALVLFWGAFTLIDGVLALAHAVMGGNMGSRWWLALVGLAGIAAGVVTFMMPGVTLLVLLWFIAAWSIVLGVFQIIGAVRLRREIDNEWTLILSGVVAVLFGLVLMLAPVPGAIGIAWVIGTYAIIFGVLLVMAALRLRKHQGAA